MQVYCRKQMGFRRSKNFLVNDNKQVLFQVIPYFLKIPANTLTTAYDFPHPPKEVLLLLLEEYICNFSSPSPPAKIIQHITRRLNVRWKGCSQLLADLEMRAKAEKGAICGTARVPGMLAANVESPIVRWGDRQRTGPAACLSMA